MSRYYKCIQTQAKILNWYFTKWCIHTEDILILIGYWFLGYEAYQVQAYGKLVLQNGNCHAWTESWLYLKQFQCLPRRVLKAFIEFVFVASGVCSVQLNVLCLRFVLSWNVWSVRSRCEDSACCSLITSQYSLISSVNIWMWECTTLGMSLTKQMKSNGPSTLPWGIPLGMSATFDIAPFTVDFFRVRNQ